MAEEAQFSSGLDGATNKRKYDDQTPPPSSARPTTGFSAPIADSAPPSSYNSVPPPLDDIQIAKQRAQEIAARLFNASSGTVPGAAPVDAKRSRVDNGGYDSSDNGKGFSSAPSEVKPMMSSSGPPSMAMSYGGFQGPTKRIDIPNGRVGVIIGKGGETIKYLQGQSGAKIQVTRDADSDPHSTTRSVDLTGTPEQISKAETLIREVLAEAEAGGSSVAPKRFSGSAGSEQFVMRVPNNKVGLVIGKGGETIKTMQAQSGARIQVIPLHLPPGDTSTERTVQIEGSSEQIEAAKQLVGEVISENRPRNQSMSGGYSQQGYQAQPTSWGPPGGQMQQSGYGYAQPGAYPPQYNMSQQQYPGYPPQPASGGWDQSNTQSAQQTTPGSGYDYYSQQAPGQQATGAPAADNTGYNYNQAPTSGYNQGQGYQQDGYGGYQAPQSGYYDQQQGYNSAPTYGTTAANPTQEGQTASYGDAAQAAPPAAAGQQGYSTQQPSPGSATYPPQAGYGSAQPQSGYGSGYGATQGQKPAAYAQPQPGYPQSQPSPAAAAYSQPDSGSQQRAPASGYGAGQPQAGYGAPAAYGAAQAGYGQAAASYNSYGSGGYPQQPPAYSGDGSAAAVSAAPGSQSGVAKASPQS